MNEVTDHLAQRVEQSIQEGDLAAAETDMQMAKRLSLQSDKFSVLREQLTAVHKENIKQRSITRLLKKAKKSYTLKQWTSPQGNNALEYYQEVLRLEPDNQDVLRGLKRMVAYFIRRMDENINIGNSQSAELNLKKAEKIQPNNPDVAKARNRWQQAIQRLGSPSDSSPEVSELVASFKQAIEQGDMDRLRSVANLSRQMQRLTEQLFSKYQTIEVSVTELMVVEQKGEASARVTLINLIDKNGDPDRPGMSWQNMQITTNKKGGRWTKINWW